MSHYYTDCEDDLDELRLEAQAQRRHRNQLARHPDPRDPGHPETDDEEDDDDV